jgi:hypothetical protein
VRDIRPVVDVLDVPLSDPALGEELCLLGDFMVAANRCASPRMSSTEIDLTLRLDHPGARRRTEAVIKQRTPAS